MAICEVCGNKYEKTMSIIVNDESRTFDCFECAIYALAPKCKHCGVFVMGHGVEKNDVIFCCAHCARESGVEGLHDHVIGEFISA